MTSNKTTCCSKCRDDFDGTGCDNPSCECHRTNWLAPSDEPPTTNKVEQAGQQALKDFAKTFKDLAQHDMDEAIEKYNQSKKDGTLDEKYPVIQDKCDFCGKELELGQTYMHRRYHPHCDPKIGVLNPSSRSSNQDDWWEKDWQELKTHCYMGKNDEGNIKLFIKYLLEKQRRDILKNQ